MHRLSHASPGSCTRAPGRAALGLALLVTLAGCGSGEAAALEAIGAVQGTAAHSPREGARVRVEGVVTQRIDDGVFLQSLVSDADPATAEGLFVMPAAGQPGLEIGQRVVAEGRVAESGDGAVLTTLVDATVDLRGTASLPEPIALDAPPISWEALEGMRVRIEAPLSVSGNASLQHFGEIDLAFGGRVFVPTERVLPGEAAIALARDNQRRRIVLDDASARQSPGAVAWLGVPLSSATPLRAGSTFHGVQGVVDQRRGAYRLQADAPVARIDQAPRPSPQQIAGNLRIAGMNLLNLFNGNGQGGGFPTERGAKNYEGYARQLAKHVATVTALDPAIIAAQELENDGYGPESAAQELADALNIAQDGAHWTVVAPAGRPGTDAIAVGLLYRADRVEVVGAPAMKLGGPFEYGSRPPLAQSFRLPGGPVFTVVSLHFKSKGGCDAAEGADRDQGDGQACFNALRVESAQTLHEWITGDPTSSGSKRVALIGDFNAYAMEDPMRWLREQGWRDAFAKTSGGADPAHSFVFQGQAGRLDHALLSPSMAADLRGAAKWMVNSDEAIDFGYDGPLGRTAEASPWRASDHDPLLLGFSF